MRSLFPPDFYKGGHTITVTPSCWTVKTFSIFFFCPQKGITTFNPSDIFGLCFMLAGNWNLIIYFWGCNDRGDHPIVSLSLLPSLGFPCSLTVVRFTRSAEAYIGLSFISNEQVTLVREMNHNRLVFRAPILIQHNNINSVLPFLMRSFHFIRQSCCFTCAGCERLCSKTEQNNIILIIGPLSLSAFGIPTWLSLKNNVLHLCAATKSPIFCAKAHAEQHSKQRGLV